MIPLLRILALALAVLTCDSENVGHGDGGSGGRALVATVVRRDGGQATASANGQAMSTKRVLSGAQSVDDCRAMVDDGAK